MFGIEELTELKEEIEKAIKIARKADKIWQEKRDHVKELIGEEKMKKIGEILEM